MNSVKAGTAGTCGRNQEEAHNPQLRAVPAVSLFILSWQGERPRDHAVEASGVFISARMALRASQSASFCCHAEIGQAVIRRTALSCSAVPSVLLQVLNLIDSTYRSELREINDINFARFEAKLNERVETLRSDLSADIARIEATMERRFGEQTRWMFVAWTALLIPIIGLWFR
jgi:hypothetical protein